MKYPIICLFLITVLGADTTIAQAPSAVGVWKTIDDEDGEEKSHIEIYEVDGKLHAKVLKLLKESNDLLCDSCKGDKKGKPLVGMEIMWNMKPEKDPSKWKGGKIMDPKKGKEYKCKIELTSEDVLKVRGYVGFSLIGRNQTWYRVKP